MTNEVAKKIIRGITDKIECNTVDIDDWAEFWGFTREEYEEFFDMAIKALEQQPCEDCISREAVINAVCAWGTKKERNLELMITMAEVKQSIVNILDELPPVKPKYTDEEIDKAQAVEQAYVDKMVELAIEEAKRPKGKWEYVQYDVNPNIGNWHCSECNRIVCGAITAVNPVYAYKYCPNCGAEMSGGGEDGE